MPELRAHVADGIAAETAQGLDRDEAERLTIERLGPADRVAAQFAADAPRSYRRAAIVVAGATLLVVAAGVGVTHTNRATTADTTDGTVVRTAPAVVAELHLLQMAAVRRCSVQLSSTTGAEVTVGCASRP